MKLRESNTPYYDEKIGNEATLTPYIVEGSRSCVVICPGGAYCHLAEHEGAGTATAFNKAGISAFVLKYRLAPYKYPAMLEDVLRAMRIVRRDSAKYGYDSDKIAIMGYSAGGHAASMALTLFDEGRQNGDETDRISSRPNLGILCYPVITMGEKTHSGSRENLLGKDCTAEMIEKLSSEKNVRDNTPPCFLWHTSDDDCVPVENSLAFALALKAKNIKFEMHIYPSGPHGMGLASDKPDVSTWFSHCVGFINRQFAIGK